MEFASPKNLSTVLGGSPSRFNEAYNFSVSPSQPIVTRNRVLTFLLFKPAILANPSLVLKAIYSRSLKSARTLAPNTPGIDLYSEDAGVGQGYKDLLQRLDIEAVIIALPIVTQPDYIKSAIEGGKHVLAEKPIAKDVATATELLNWYNKNTDTRRATLCVAENYRFFDSVVFASEQVKKLGRVLGFNVRVQAMVRLGGKYIGTSWIVTLSTFEQLLLTSLQKRSGVKSLNTKADFYLTRGFISLLALECYLA